MKKTFVAFLLICVMAMSFTLPAMANSVTAYEPTKTTVSQGFVEIQPFTEMTRIYHRNHHGRLQFRVWGMTSGRWLTDWAYV